MLHECVCVDLFTLTVKCEMFDGSGHVNYCLFLLAEH